MADRARIVKFGVGGGLVVVGLVTLAVWAASRPGAISYFVTPSEAVGQLESLAGRTVRVSASIVPDSVRRGPENTLRFVVADAAAQITVTYSGAVPYTFKQAWQTKGWQVVVEGTLHEGPSLRATNVFVRHPPEMAASRRANGVKGR